MGVALRNRSLFPSDLMSDISSESDSCDRLSPPDSPPAAEPELRHGAEGSRIAFHIAFAAFVRFTLVFYGVFHDQMFDVKYTDVDYVVFTDAARFMRQGRSPFLREGYRYTPLIAFLLVPNLYVALFGKVLFVIFDLLTGYLIFRILTGLKSIVPPGVAVLSTLTWLYNPLPLVVSSRGSSDSIETFLVVAFFACLLQQRTAAAGLFFGLAIHVKLYPVIYAPAAYLLLMNGLPNGSILSCHLWNPLNRRRVSFFVSALIAFASSTAVCWRLYGDRYVDESWLYHFLRKDVQHNFSVYFYMYRLAPLHYHRVISSLAFVPQLVAVVISLRHLTSVTRSQDELFAKFLCTSFQQTLLFVSLNKVITSQYFLWYLCLFPFILPLVPDLLDVEDCRCRQEGRLRIEPNYWFSHKFLAMVLVWMSGQAIWLLPAYLYEFRKWESSLVYVWIASIAFLAINLMIAFKLSPCFPQLNNKKDP